jgi:hypothetical protein
MKKNIFVLTFIFLTNSLYADDFDNNQSAGLPLSTSSTSTITGFAITGIVYMSITSGSNGLLSLRRLNIQNEALAQDVTVGEGPELRALAAFFEQDKSKAQYQLFSRKMRSHRKEVSLLLENDQIEELEQFIVETIIEM